MVQKSRSHDECILGVKESLDTHMGKDRYAIELFNAENFDERTLNKLIREIVEKRFDLIFPIGTTSSLAVKHFTINEVIKIPAHSSAKCTTWS
jgi:ABC-type uncharacterized transport system substrate-binding protein